MKNLFKVFITQFGMRNNHWSLVKQRQAQVGMVKPLIKKTGLQAGIWKWWGIESWAQSEGPGLLAGLVEMSPLHGCEMLPLLPVF